MYLGRVNRPAACSWSSPDPSRLTSMSWLDRRRPALGGERGELADPARQDPRRSPSAIAPGLRVAPRSPGRPSQPGASAKAGSFFQSRTSSRPRATTAQK